MIDHRKQFGSHKSDHLPVKMFPMIDHLTAKLFPMIDHLTVKPFPMIDHRKQFEIHLSDHLTAKTMSMDELPPTEVFLFLFLGKFCHSQAVQFLCNFCTCEEEAELQKAVLASQHL